MKNRKEEPTTHKNSYDYLMLDDIIGMTSLQKHNCINQFLFSESFLVIGEII